MTALIPFLVFCQALGALVGAVTSVWGELAYIRDMRDGKIDTAERAHLNIIARGLRFGMILILLASLGLVIVAYTSGAALQPALTPAYWTLIMLALLVVGISWALFRRHISFAFGSAALFTSWWFLVYLTLGLLSPLSFGSSAALLVVATAIIYALLRYVRILAGYLAKNGNKPRRSL